MTEEDRILDKIKKLLRLSRSSNPHEAALALQRAMEIAQANSIHLASIDPDDEVAGIRHKERMEARLHYEKRLAISLVQDFFSVRIIRGWNNLKIVGRAPDIQIAEYAYVYVVRACRLCMAAWEKEEAASRRRVTINKRRSFILGFMEGVRKNLAKLSIVRSDSLESVTAVLATNLLEKRRRDDYVAERWKLGKLPPVSFRVTDGAATNGFLDGMKTNINRPVAGAGLTHPRQLAQNTVDHRPSRSGGSACSAG